MNTKTIADTILARYNHLNTSQTEIFDEVEVFKAMYRCKMDADESYPWEYQLTDPQIFPAIRNYLSRLNPAEARVELIGQGDNREVNQKLVNWELNEILITQILFRLLYTGFMTGKGYIKTGWHYKPALKIKTDNRGEVLIRELQNRADAVNVRFNDLFIPNRNIPDLQKQPYLIERVNMRYGDLLDDQEQTGRWKPDLIKKIGDKKMFDNIIDYGEDLQTEDVGKEDSLLRSQNVTLLCMTTIDGEEFWRMAGKEGIDDILNKDTSSRYWHGHYPYIDFSPFPEDDEFFSMGVPHTMADLEIALSSTLNQLLTSARKAGNNMWLIGDSAGSGMQDWMFVDRPNGVIRAKGDISQYQRLESSAGASRELVSLRNELTQTVEKTTGMSSLYTSGVASTPTVNKTARGAEVIERGIDQNLQLIISLFGAQVVKQLGEHFIELNAQFMTEEQVIEISGKHGKYDFVTIDPAQVGANFKVKASPERMLKESPAVKLASLQNTIQTLEGQKSVTTNMKPMYQELILSTPSLEEIDVDEVIVDPEKKVEEIIKAINEGYEAPSAKWNDDHKAMMAMIQKHLIDVQYPDEVLQLFVDYLTDLKKWIDAKNQSLIVQPPPQPQLLPTDEQALAQSMGDQMSQNPTDGMMAQMTQAQLGI